VLRIILGEGAIAVGALLLLVAGLRGSTPTRQFRLTDLFRNHSLVESSRAQLAVEGLFGIAIGILVLTLR
jgi:hypothetical protein